MRVIRGTGAEGLEGIPPVRDGWIVRPLLAFTKDEILRYLSGNDILYMTDETNADADYFRNRIRHEIMPAITKENPLFAQSVGRMCEIIRINNDFIAQAAGKVPVMTGKNTASVSYEALMRCHAAVRYAVIMNMAHAAGFSKDYGYANISALMRMLDRPQNTSWDIHLPGSVFKRRYDTLTVCAQPEISAEDGFCFKVKVPSTHIFAASGIYVKIYQTKNVKNLRNKFIKYIDYAKIKNILVLRSRREGDSFVKFGQTGSKTLKKYFIDQKITREARASVPILADGVDVVCVCGYEIDDRYKTDEATNDFLAIECGRLKYGDEG
jgi:tRNA(Ile)-lysidine synthase